MIQTNEKILYHLEFKRKLGNYKAWDNLVKDDLPELLAVLTLLSKIHGGAIFNSTSLNRCIFSIHTPMTKAKKFNQIISELIETGSPHILAKSDYTIAVAQIKN